MGFVRVWSAAGQRRGHERSNRNNKRIIEVKYTFESPENLVCVRAHMHKSENIV